ncbi:ankyrin repeat domain-containing protein [Marinoscillum furvescens]|uniref:Ankyrin repeat protein n=1 Tax=Marinoscillum furvescens DSM 4134 TaxID=1122208 RepID=A0A3D9L184_MARFU|nr:ankyrin repeat domain-containing protein [Marinoscillum furvescens]RED96578.1 ankyrin repeat protein [Marinoscillum furvescens DSM 4134]
MNKLLSIPLLFLVLSGFGQQGNSFLEPSFWKENPSVKTIKKKIKEGHDPAALNDNAFDGVTYAINANASLESILFMLEQEGNSVDKITHDNRNYLMWAARMGNKPLIEHLIKEGSNTNLTDSHGYNALTFAAVAGVENMAIYDLLLSTGIAATSTNRSGANALHLLAGSMKNDALIRYFEQKGLSIRSLDHNENGLFHYAAQRGNIEMMNLLIAEGLPYRTLNKAGENAMILASKSGRRGSNGLEVFQFLDSKGVAADIVSWEGNTPLHGIAAGAKDEAIFDFFVDKGVNVNQVNEEGNTAFMLAAQRNNLKMLQKAEPYTHDINRRNHEGESAVILAVKSGAASTFEYLKTRGADLSFKDAKGNDIFYHMFQSHSKRNAKAFQTFLNAATANNLKPDSDTEILHIAVEKGEISLVKTALKLGAKINHRNEEGLTPLHLAAMKAQSNDILHLLLEHGADKGIKTEFEESAYDLAQENEVLAKNGVDLSFLKAN